MLAKLEEEGKHIAEKHRQADKKRRLDGAGMEQLLKQLMATVGHDDDGED